MAETVPQASQASLLSLTKSSFSPHCLSNVLPGRVGWESDGQHMAWRVFLGANVQVIHRHIYSIIWVYICLLYLLSALYPHA